MAKDPTTARNAEQDQARQPAGPIGPPEERQRSPERQVRRRPKGWLQALAERFGAYPAED